MYRILLADDEGIVINSLEFIIEKNFSGQYEIETAKSGRAAIEAADVVLMKSGLKDAVALIKLSRRTLRIIHQNLFWAFFYNALGIPLAAGVFIPVFGWIMNPMFGAAAMSLSSFCVVSNALRLRK